MEVKVEYTVELASERVAEALFRALFPDTSNLPEACSAEIDLDGRKLSLRINCSSISKLRALSNSFIGVLTSLLRVVGDTQSVNWESTGETSTT